jgi:alkanesulfonate monooxygenase SsuD/methylene tetrahydromethanopterin reductase-like flavin-dependent oxidoreductase (luciferase family)
MNAYWFGVNVGPSRSRAEWADKARKLEDLGYSTLTVPDHLGDFFAPMPTLISAAEATKNLRVGANVLNNHFRHPVVVAREAATIDLLTEGRLQLGLGAVSGPRRSDAGRRAVRKLRGGTDPSQAFGGIKGTTIRLTAPAYWKFESSLLQQRVTRTFGS